jgi:acyl CoA:acetate/3-ketoacid CoA transferase
MEARFMSEESQENEKPAYEYAIERSCYTLKEHVRAIKEIAQGLDARPEEMDQLEAALEEIETVAGNVTTRKLTNKA